MDVGKGVGDLRLKCALVPSRARGTVKAVPRALFPKLVALLRRFSAFTGFFITVVRLLCLVGSICFRNCRLQAQAGVAARARLFDFAKAFKQAAKCACKGARR